MASTIGIRVVSPLASVKETQAAKKIVKLLNIRSHFPSLGQLRLFEIGTSDCVTLVKDFWSKELDIRANKKFRWNENETALFTRPILPNISLQKKSGVVITKWTFHWVWP